MKWTAACCSLGIVVGSAASARAASPVLIRQLDDYGDTVKVDDFAFETNATLGRAWVKLIVYTRPIVESDSGDTDGYDEVRTWVPGLSLVGDRVVFSSGIPGAPGVVCATVVHRRFLFFRYDDVVRTGRCVVTTTPGTRAEDDGFVVKTVPVLKVYFQTRG